MSTWGDSTNESVQARLGTHTLGATALEAPAQAQRRVGPGTPGWQSAAQPCARPPGGVPDGILQHRVLDDRPAS